MTKVYVVTREDENCRRVVDAVYSTEEAALADVRDYNSSGWTWTWKDYREMTLDTPSDLW